MINSELEALNSSIKKEADEILNGNGGLLRILEGYGKVSVSGSYFLDLMTWRDLDIYITSDDINEESFFALGKDISLCLKPSKMSYRNELIGRTSHLPKGYYWGCYTNINANAWKVDVWSISQEEFDEKEKAIHDLKSQLNEGQRMVILSLKNGVYSHPLYRKQFFSVDIYHAVIHDNVNNADDFKEWLLHNREIRL